MTGKNKTRLVGWHPSDPALVGWLDAEIERRGGGRGAQSAILDEALEKAMNDTGTTRTEFDLRVIARARALYESADLEAVRSAAADPGISTYAEAFGVARVGLGDLLAIIDRGDGHG